MRNLCGCLPFCLPRREAGLTFHEVISGYCFCYSYSLLLLHNTYSWPEQSEEKENGSAMHPGEKSFRCFKIDKVTKTRRVKAHFKLFNKFKHSKSIFQKNPFSFFWSCTNKNLLVKNASQQIAFRGRRWATNKQRSKQFKTPKLMKVSYWCKAQA